MSFNVNGIVSKEYKFERSTKLNIFKHMVTFCTSSAFNTVLILFVSQNYELHLDMVSVLN